MEQSRNIGWLRTEHESLKVDLLEGTLGAEPHIVEQFEDYFDGVEELIVSHESQAAEIDRLKAELELRTRERDGFRLLALFIYDWVCQYRNAKHKMYEQEGSVQDAAIKFLPASEGSCERFVRKHLGTPYASSGLTESVNDLAKTIEAHLAGRGE